MASYLPTNVSVSCPADQSTYDNIKNATLFTRLHLNHALPVVAAMLDKTPAVEQNWCMAHQNIILVFDCDKEAHVSHVRIVLQAIIDNNMTADIDGCVFYAPDAAKAGFVLDVVGTGEKRAIMVVDQGMPAGA